MNQNLAIYYEHPEWFVKLFAALDRRDIGYTKIDAAHHFFDPEAAPEFDILFNRMSASAYLRGHGNAMFYTQSFLEYLESKGVRVINGAASFAIETSKARHLALLDALGVKYPKTRVINSPEQVIIAARQIGFPLVVKPNIGGRGAGIIKLDSISELEKAVENNQIDLGIDSTALVQKFAKKRGEHINRVETLGGKFLYAIKIYPTEESFNLCPAEVCIVENQVQSVGEICIADAPKTGLKIEKFTPPPEIIETVERIVEAANIDRIGGGGRLSLNVVSSWWAGEAKKYGVQFDEHDDRYARTSEWLEIVDKLWKSDHFDFAGEYYKIEDAVMQPKPINRPVIYAGGESEKAKDTIARQCDAYVMHGDAPEKVKLKIDDMESRREKLNLPPMIYGVAG
jgi:hypothetical protein